MNVVKQFSSIFSFIRNINPGPLEMDDDDIRVNIDSVNGLILSKYFLPEEILAKILGFVSWKTLLSCRLVCHSWKRLIDNIVCYDKLKTDCRDVVRNSFTSPIVKLKPSDVPFYLGYAIAHNVFGVNHLKNSFGEDCPKFKHWTVTASGGDGWIIEDLPVGSQLLPANLGGKSCFVTSYSRCRMEQLIILNDCGLNNKVMDEIQPHIEVSEWYAKRFDCGIIYALRVCLLNSENEVIDHFSKEVEDRNGDDDWHQLSHTFKDYGPGVRFVLFQHGGRDTQFWAGHYGSKMAGGAVVARINPYDLQKEPDKS